MYIYICMHMCVYIYIYIYDPPPQIFSPQGGKGGFEPGGASLHGVGTPHGPDAKTFAAASSADTSVPAKTQGFAFMFETSVR